MPLDGYFIYHLQKEFETNLKGVRIKKIRQTSKDTFVFTYYKQGEKHLVFELNPNKSHVRISQTLPYGEVTSNLLNALKRHLENAEITNITQYQMDRVLIFNFQKFDQIFGYAHYTVIYETMGRTTNLIILENNIVIEAYYKQFSADKRSILNKSEFIFFPSDKKVFSETDLTELRTIDDPKYFMNTYMGFALDTAKFFVETKLNPLTLPIEPTLILGEKRQFFSFNPNTGQESKTYPTLSALLEAFYTFETPKYMDLEKLIDKEIKRLDLKLNNLFGDLEQNRTFEASKQLADDIYTHATDLQAKVSHFKEIPLDPQKTLNEHAQSLYQKYQKAKKSILPIESQITQTKAYKTYYQDIKDQLSILSSNDLDDIKKELSEVGLIKLKINPKKKPAKPTLLLVKGEDFEIYIGKTSEQNNYLTNTFAQPNDYWFHVQQGPGAHVVLRGAFHEQSLRLSAMLAAYHSPQRKSSSIPVDYTKVRNLKKIKGLPGYNVTYTNQKTIYIDIDETKILSL
ncbi:NFACT family protein [Acholeplasma vituli]|uniref:NFACT family protein n=1 Tax=Paracholeplasma vituli TaxID=69473 RepID=A0ABT2PUC4_9MOLU|nr:NFACT family protein [Paracholeplasma vituli]MCU0104532.1 NFACT family protein [Paracholeplasma vituli]